MMTGHQYQLFPILHLIKKSMSFKFSDQILEY